MLYLSASAQCRGSERQVLVCVCVCVCVLSHLHPCGETHAYKMVLWGVLTLWGNESLPHKE